MRWCWFFFNIWTRFFQSAWNCCRLASR